MDTNINQNKIIPYESLVNERTDKHFSIDGKVIILRLAEIFYLVLEIKELIKEQNPQELNLFFEKINANCEKIEGALIELRKDLTVLDQKFSLLFDIYQKEKS